MTYRATAMSLAAILVSATMLHAQGAKKSAVPIGAATAKTQPSQAGNSEREADRDHAIERQGWFHSGRSVVGENAAELLQRAYRQKMELRAVRREEERRATEASIASRAYKGPGLGPARQSPIRAATPSFSFLHWSNMGPSPIISDPTGLQSYGAITGRVTAIAVDQKDPTGNTVYVGGAFGGVWKSVNAASADPSSVTWQPIFDDQPTLAIGAIAIQPNGDVVLVGTGEANNGGDSYYGMGVARSTNGGASWTLVQSANGGTRSFRGLGFSAIAFSTVNTQLVVAATAATIGASDGAEVQGASGRGLYYSTDAGQTWAYANVQDPAGPTQAGSSNTVVFNPKLGKFFAAIRFHGYYSSSDGINWSRLPDQSQPSNQINNTACPAATAQTCPLYRASLTVRNDTGEMYTTFVDANGSAKTGGGIFQYSAAIGGWSRLGQGGFDACGDSDGCGTQQGTYNLYLRAVPNGSTTDLYFGTVNLFKCSISNTDSQCALPGAWKNLTHVYGCPPVIGMPAHVHPDQHAIDFSEGSPLNIYFGNDGGLYRTINAAGLNSSSCAQPNAFDNLNGGLGSLSQFVNFSQHPSDPSIVLGGLQDNGSPLVSGTNSGATGRVWTDANNGDGGYTAIDPNSPNTFYTANFDVSLQRCTAGVACDQNSWVSVAGSSNLNGDTSAFYLPYLLDPQNTSNLVLGTCRVWIGNDTTGYVAASNNFTKGDSSPCTGSTSSGDTKIRALAVGGPVGANGSKVIYAGMEGSGSPQPGAGSVFVTTNADGGPAAWADRTGNINPSLFPISDIAISPYDATGNTAYVTIMGFGTGHVFKTANAGINWSDISSNLPDSPANTIAVDPTTQATLYVGADVGAFISTDDGVTWTEFGAGLPSVPVVKLKTFIANGVRKLRAATYGRGLWQIELPSSSLAFSKSALNFAAVLGHTSLAQTATLTNSTPNSIILNSIVSSVADYVISSDCPASLAIGASCTIRVIFTPRLGGARNGAIVISDSSIGSPHTVSLNGVGLDFQLLPFRPARPARNRASTVVTAGQSTTFSFSVQATSLSGLSASMLEGLRADGSTTVRLECVELPKNAECRIEPAAVDLMTPRSPVSVIVTTSRARPRAKRLGSSRRRDRTPAGSYTLRVSAASGTASRSVGFDFIVR